MYVGYDIHWDTGFTLTPEPHPQSYKFCPSCGSHEKFSETKLHFRGLNFRWSKIIFIDIHLARSKPAIVYTEDARNEDFCQIVQYYGYGRTR